MKRGLYCLFLFSFLLVASILSLVFFSNIALADEGETLQNSQQTEQQVGQETARLAEGQQTQAQEQQTEQQIEKQDDAENNQPINDEDSSDIPEKFADEKLDRRSGITPDSYFYFIEDKILTRFRSDIDNKEKKIAEFREMIKEGDIDAAKKSLDRYMEYANKLEKEVSPERKEEAQRSAAAIRNTIKDLEAEIPAKDRKEIVKSIVDLENRISKAAEIAAKIQELCTSLSELDPEVFYDNCKVGDEGPTWRKKMYKELTSEQEEEARKFAKIMKQCFKTSGKECACDKIPYEDFAYTCSIAAPLATSCDIDGNEIACKELDELELPQLPPHLQEIMDDLEQGNNEKYGLHMPPECKKAGATTPEECSNIMVLEHAPKECKEELLAADIKTEREGREICDKIMMKQHAPECVEQGINDPEKCKDFMWNIEKRPEECKKNRIHDYKDCKRFLEEGNKEFKEDYQKGFKGPNCGEIKDAKERLACYDDAVSDTGERYKQKQDYGNVPEECKKANAFEPKACEKHLKDVQEWKQHDFEKEKEFIQDCESKRGRWDCSGGQCKCDFDNYNRGPEDSSGGPGSSGGSGGNCGDCASKCETRTGQRLSGTSCINNQCACYYESSSGPGSPEGSSGSFGGGDTTYPGPGAQFAPGENPPNPTPVPGTENPPSEQSSSTGSGASVPSGSSSGSGGSGSSSESESGSSSGSGGSGGITGNVLLDNDFLKYYFRA